MPIWHTLSSKSAFAALESSTDGLSEQKAKERLEEYGPNRLEAQRLRSPWVVLAGQFTEIMVIVLLVAAALSFIVHEPKDGVMILVIVVLNAILGFSQEYRAERAMAALQQLAVPTVRVRRNGKVQEIEADLLVPGDVVLLEAGNRVPADARVIRSVNLRVEEAALTGESVPVDKLEESLSDDGLTLGDRVNMVYMGTTIVYGRGEALVVETGMSTELGNIANLLQTTSEEKTPLQRRMAELGKWLAIGALVICAIVFAVGLISGQRTLTEMFLTAVSLAVAAVPEGLPAVVTIALALGAQRMVRRQALIRKLPAVETLGSVTTICSDKTGTLTENRMTVTMLDVAGRSLDLTTHLRNYGALLHPDDPPIAQPNIDLTMLLAGGALCNDALLEAEDDGENQGYHALGDPTEGALVVAAARLGLWKDRIDALMPRMAEAPFTSERKRMTTVHRIPTAEECKNGEVLACLAENLPDVPMVAFTKGAVEGLLAICNRVWAGGAIEPMNPSWEERIRQADNSLAQKGMRVLGVALRPMQELPEKITEESLEQELVFVGLSGMIDPPRAEVRDAVAECRTAGIRPIMITGDHPLTALNIARDLGIAAEDASLSTEDGQVITGIELAGMSVEELEASVENVSVYARVSPEHKVKIVEALKNKGHFVAMTGDGVNDAPALKRADIGVAMGITGTDVSKEAADMVLLDDNFATIVHAIEEGRTIYENIRRFVRYIVSCNVGEIFIMLMAPLLGLEIPLSAIQLLWINLVTDGLPALALGVEPSDPQNMKRPPHEPGESVLARGLGSYVLWVGLLLGIVSLIAQLLTYHMPSKVWQTMVFATLALSQMGNALAVRSDRESLFSLGLFTNMPLLGAIALTVALQAAVIYVPFMQNTFGTTALTGGQLLATLGLSSVVFIAVEIQKWIARTRDSRPA